MKKLQRIVVGINIFAKSSNVLKRALSIAEENKAELYIIQAVPVPWFSVPDYFTSKNISIDKKAIKKKIEKKIEELNTKSKVACYVFVKEGDPSDIILYKSKLLKADMIVIGAHLKSKKIKNMIGSTAQKIANQSHLPVLVVKNRVQNPYTHAIAPTDFQAQSRQCVLFAKNVFPNIKIKALHAHETFYARGPYTIEGFDPEEYIKASKAHAEKDLEDFVKDLDIKEGEVINGKADSKKALINFIKRDLCDLVVVGSRGTAGFKALLGSIASYILREAPTDVLVYVPID